MSLIEGIGDEVTIGFSVFLLLLFVLLAWFSTHTRDIPFVSIIVVELSQRRGRARNAHVGDGASSSSSTTSEESAGVQQTDSGSVPEAGSGDTTNNSTNNDSPISANVEDTPSEQGSDDGDSSVNVVPDGHGQSSDHPPVVRQDSTNTNPNLPDILSSSGTVRADSENGPSENPSPAANAASACTSGIVSTLGVSDDSILHLAKSSDEIRRRRLAFFDMAKDKRYSESELQATESVSLGAETEKPAIIAGISQAVACEEYSENNKQSTSGQTGSQADESHVSSTTTQGQSDFITTTTPSHTHEATTAASATQSQVPDDIPEGTSADTQEMTGTSGEQIRVRLKYLNDTQRLVYADPQETVGNFRRLHFSEELDENKIVRFIFNGQDLRNDLSTLRAYNVADNSVIHCLITHNRQDEQNANAQHADEDDNNMGDFLYPVFGLILGLVWYLRFTYKQYFNAMSTVSLAGVSFIYLLALFSSIRHRRQPHQHLE